MHQIQIHEIQPKALKAFIECFFDAGVIGAPQFGSDEQVFAVDHPLIQDFLERFSN